MIPSLEGLPTKAKEAPSPHEVRLSPLDTNPVFHSLGDYEKNVRCLKTVLWNHACTFIAVKTNLELPKL